MMFDDLVVVLRPPEERLEERLLEERLDDDLVGDLALFFLTVFFTSTPDCFLIDEYILSNGVGIKSSPP